MYNYNNNVNESVTSDAFNRVQNTRNVYMISSIFGLLFWIAIIVIVIKVVANKKNKNKESNSSSSTNNNYSAQTKMAAKDYKIDSWGEFIKVAVISGFFGFIGYAFSSSNSDMNTFVWTWGFAGFPWGYSVISKIIDDWVELYAALASSTMWFIVFIIKIALSVMLGFVLMPIKIVISLYHIISAHSWDKEVNGKQKQVNQSEKKDNKDIKEKEKMIDVKVEEKAEKKESKNDNSEMKKIKELKNLYDEGILTKEEFEEKKKELLKKI